MQKQLIDYALPMIELDQLMIKYRKAMLNNQFHDTLDIAVHMKEKVNLLIEYSIIKRHEVQSR